MAENLLNDTSPQILRFASGTQSYPFTYIEDGEEQGIYKDLLELVATGSPYRVEVAAYPAGRVITALKNAEIDLFPHFEMGENIKFKDIPNTVVCEEPLFSVKMSLFSLAPVKNSTTNAGTSNVGWMRYHYVDVERFSEYIPFEVNFLYAHSYPQLAKMLLANRVDYVISSVPNFYASYKALQGDAEVIEENIFPSATVTLGFSMNALGDKTEVISQQFCRQVGRLQDSGSIDKIIAKYSKLKYFNKP
ncbi:hypothetical protein R50073_09800 [Maricurvus nonylphenolicus]|uniref:substrate-binding periplasmic protein n=1 Tax=Maricurvus nonylphenolicus TaxID=1008307 RepID=UPI0036F2AC10